MPYPKANHKPTTSFKPCFFEFRQLHKTFSFKKHLPLLMNVPGRTGIRIHTGSKPEHSQGCILVGAIGKKMIEELITLNNTYNEKTYIKITEAYGSQAEGTWQQSFGKVAPYHPQLALPSGFTDGIDPERALPE